MIEEREGGAQPPSLSPGVSPSAAALLARLREAAADRAPAGAQGIGSRLAARRRAAAESWDDGLPGGGPGGGGPGGDGLPDGEGGWEGPAPARRLGIPRRAAWAALAVTGLVCALLMARASTQDGPVETVLPSRRPAVALSRASPVTGGGTGTGVWAGVGPGDAGAPPSRSGAGPGASPSALVVDVVGRVRRPGLVRLAPGSRVWDAVLAAGGAAPGSRLDRVNLARPVADGEQVRVPGANDPVPPEPPPATVAGAPAAASTSGAVVIDLNAATAEQLDALPGVGPVLAARILQWRAGHGRFSRVEELGEVDGIGPKLFAHLRPRVRV